VARPPPPSSAKVIEIVELYSRAIRLLPLWAFVAYSRVTFTFTFIFIVSYWQEGYNDLESS